VFTRICIKHPKSCGNYWNSVFPLGLLFQWELRSCCIKKVREFSSRALPLKSSTARPQPLLAILVSLMLILIARSLTRSLSCACYPFPSNRHHPSNGDCLEGKRDNYQVCSVQYSVPEMTYNVFSGTLNPTHFTSVQYCVQQLYTVNCTHVNRTNSSLDWVLSHCVCITVYCMHV